MGKIQIFVTCHKPCFVPRHELLYPIQVGAANAEEHFAGMLYDDEGTDNISVKNPKYCELTGQYWVWKHVDAEYYGFFHYRRYMSFSQTVFPHNSFQDVKMDRPDEATLERLGYDAESMRALITQYDVITTLPAKLKDLNRSFHNNYEQYISKPCEYKEDIELVLQIISEKCPEYYEIANKYIYQLDYGYFCNMFIMKKEIFHRYSEWLFDILAEHEKRRDCEDYNIDAYRVSGYLGERLFGVYYLYLLEQGRCKTLEVQRTLFDNVDAAERVSPAFEEKNIPVVIAANDKYAPYCGTLLLSIMDHADAQYHYDILLLSHDISETNQMRLRELICGTDNFRIRFLDPDALLKGYHLYTRAHFSVETYYRLALPQLLPDYDKVLYLDVDMIAQADAAELYQTNVEGYLLAAVYDIDTAGLYSGFQPDKKTYVDRELKLQNPYHYFQAGALVLNLKEFRDAYTLEYMLSLAASKNWQLLDQDVLNVLCENRVKYLDMSWNVLYDYGNLRISHVFRLAPQWMYRMYAEARKAPKIIHYAGPEKPWKYPNCDFADIFWKYARQTSYYEWLLYQLHTDKKKQVTDDKMFIKKSNSPIYKTIRCLRLYGIGQTIRECKREIAERFRSRRA